MHRNRTIAAVAVLALAAGGTVAGVLIGTGSSSAEHRAVAPTTTTPTRRGPGTAQRPGRHLRLHSHDVQETTTTIPVEAQTTLPTVPAQPSPLATPPPPPTTLFGHGAGVPHRHGASTTTLLPTPPAKHGVGVPHRHGAGGTRPTSPTVTAPFSDAAAQAEGEEASYVVGAWCGPLEEASGKPLAVLEQDVARSTAEMGTTGAPSLASSLRPATGQVEPEEGVMLLYGTDLATADAIVPPGANLAKAVLHTTYCVGAPGPLTGYQVTHGGAGTIDFEAAYGISIGPKTTWWHLWWQVAPAFGPCANGTGTCLAAWDAPRSPVAYWAAQRRSLAPHYVVAGPGGTWRLTTPGQAQRASRPHKAAPPHKARKRPSKRATGQTTKKR